MPRDIPPSSVSVLPGWLTPGLIDVLARGIEAELASGTLHPTVAERAFERARCLHPALPTPHLREAVAIALWVARPPIAVERVITNDLAMDARLDAHF